jgi:hypothetical protein
VSEDLVYHLLIGAARLGDYRARAIYRNQQHNERN